MKKFYILAILILVKCIPAFSQDKNYSEWYLQRPDVDVYVREEGTGNDTVVVVHGGFGANHNYMLDAISGVKDKYHFVLYDQRGSLLSPCKKENLTFQKNVEDLYELIRAMRLKKVKLLCHSMGALVGMEFIKQHPDMVSNVVLVSSILPKSDSMKTVFSNRVYKQVDTLQKRPEIGKLLKPYKDKGLDLINSFEALDSSQLTQKQLTDVWRINFAATNIYDVNKFNQVKGGRAYYKIDPSIMTESVNWNFDYRPVLNKLNSVTFIQSEFDYLDFNADVHRQLLKDYPKLKLRLVKNAGHYTWIDDPATYTTLLIEGLSPKN